MKHVKIIGGAGMALIILLASVYAYGSGPGIDLSGALGENEELSSFLGAMEASGVMDSLDPSMEYTILAPTNDAFLTYNEELYGGLYDDMELFTNLMKYHVIEGDLSVADLSKIGSIATLSGEEIFITTSGQVELNGVAVDKGDQTDCKDGRIVILDSVLLPPTLTETYIDLTIIDAAGREVYIKKVPERIISLASSATETLFAIDAGDLLVGRDKYSTFPEETQGIPNLGSGSSLALEEALNLNPDLVITWYYSTDAIESLEQNGVTVLAVGPSSVQEVMDLIDLFGTICGKGEEVITLLSTMNDTIDRVQSVVASIPQEEKVKVYYELSTVFKSVNGNTFTGQIIELAGGINISSDLETTYPKLSSEWIIDQNPDVIAVVSYGATLDDIKSRDGWGSIDAVINDKVYSIESNWVSATPRLVLGLEQFAKWFYPEHFV